MNLAEIKRCGFLDCRGGDREKDFFLARMTRMDTDTAHFSRNRAFDFLRPAVRRGGRVLALRGNGGHHIFFQSKGTIPSKKGFKGIELIAHGV